ncbi:MAG: four helix bundle protein [Flavobacteriales bacterium]|nr:four helix bundle protein [Flavobacteriales bacterium]
MKNFKQLLVWQKAMTIVGKTYHLVSGLPPTEKYGLASQMTRAAISVAANIAEGSSRRSEKDYFRFLEIALGSLFELETLIHASAQAGHKLPDEEVDDLLNQIEQEQKMLTAFMDKLNKS